MSWSIWRVAAEHVGEVARRLKTAWWSEVQSTPVLRRYESRTNWSVGIGLSLSAASVQTRIVEETPFGSWPWLAGLFAGLGVIPTIYGCVSYAKGKGHRAGLGGVLGAVLVLGWLMLGALQDRHKRGASDSQPSPEQ